MSLKKKHEHYTHYQFTQSTSDYSQIQPALQQIPAHSTLELSLWLVSSR